MTNVGREQEGPAQRAPLLNLQWGAGNGIGPVQRLAGDAPVPFPVPARGAVCLPEDAETLRKRVAARLARPWGGRSP